MILHQVTNLAFGTIASTAITMSAKSHIAINIKRPAPILSPGTTAMFTQPFTPKWQPFNYISVVMVTR